ncbi:vacuolar fusion protein MON1 [Desarmillaria ectypa]|nr:vacuolar fusion protein MON1 [Desarmillaria ectypa]
MLRDQLRKTLNRRPSRELPTPSRKRGKKVEVALDVDSKYAPREYFVLTDAGKPVFTSQTETESESFTSIIGVMQALISVFIDDHDKLRCINAGNTRIAFLQRSPLYYACVSSWGEPESVTRSHLEFLHLQILSIVTASQLRRIFERRTNFDLRRLLDGTETFLHSMLDRLEFDLAMATSSLHCLRLDPMVRKRVADTLVPTSKVKDILYVILVARGRVVTLIRPKKHSIHPADIHILMNTVHNPSIYNSPAAASWIPICLPKFNPNGFMNAYISFLQRDNPEESTALSPGSPQPSPSDNVVDSDSGTALVCLSGGADFDTIRSWCDRVTQKLTNEGTLKLLLDCIRSGQSEYAVAELGIPGLRHFVYKSRAQVQVTFPTFEDPYENLTDRRRIITLYQVLHDAIHAKSGQSETLKLQYIRTEKESVMGWITQPFEMYIALSPRLPKSAAVGAANAVSRWVKKEEGRLFLKDAPVF